METKDKEEILLVVDEFKKNREIYTCKKCGIELRHGLQLKIIKGDYSRKEIIE